eukprot:CAMPEP_0117694844 /NCGR_PEP_ID=MMETSP0804-20121206/27729_1 /TAXON_ID=1074897 /ORGANISM="Tetraselmis astigmatica, Strain CCMP880" /LENGTH=284 /DNA_ID=CAMNT_0005508689 /DNA_START=196 /DNA_END=1051 /DNA_ORIENTATION=-
MIRFPSSQPLSPLSVARGISNSLYASRLQMPEDELQHTEVELLSGGLMGCVTTACNGARTRGATGVVLLHGASGTMRSPHMERLSAILAKAGLLCVRYTHISPKVEKRADKLQEVLTAVKGQVESTRHVLRWILAGHSMGARAVCHYAHSNTVPGLVLCSYPVHPPNNHDNVRDTPLTLLKVPLLWIRGSKDPFCCEDVFKAVFARMASSKMKLLTVENGDHSLGRSSKPLSEDVTAQITNAVEEFVSTVNAATNEKSSLKRGAESGKATGARSARKKTRNKNT